MKFLKMIKAELGRLKLLLYSNAPIWLIIAHFKLNYSHLLARNRWKLIKYKETFKKLAKTLELPDDWFSNSIPTWLKAFEKNNYDRSLSWIALKLAVGKGCQLFSHLITLKMHA